MTGSEKQIKWAEDIRAELIPELDDLEAELKDVQANPESAKTDYYADDSHLLRLKHGDGVYPAISAIRNCNNAKWFIDFGRSGAREAVHAAISGNTSMGGLI